MEKDKILGIDLGGTQLRGGLVSKDQLPSIRSIRINAQASATQMIQELLQFTEGLLDPSVKAIGIGVPGLVHARGSSTESKSNSSW